MAKTPQINYPDGSGTTVSLTITTNSNGLAFSGVIDNSTVDVQVNVNGNGFISDPTLIEILPGQFRYPNPSSYPNGIDFDYGASNIQLRAVDLSGGVSPASNINITVINITGNNMQQPTGVVIQRRANSVDIMWSNLTTTNANGYNIYASTGAGGTDSGYMRVNLDMIPANTVTTGDYYENLIGTVDYMLSDTDGSSNLQIVSDAIDPATGLTRARKSVNWIPLVGDENYRMTINVYGMIPVQRFTFNHNRSYSVVNGIMNSDTFGTVSNDTPLYYVITALYFDKNTGNYFESLYSQELPGNPLPLDQMVRGIQIRDQTIVTQDYITEIQKTAPTLSLIPGSTVREVHIEPFSNEAQKIYFLLDFVHRAKSFTALLQIDDPNLTGVSIPVENSQYKMNLRSALNSADDTPVQNLIDGAFDALAQNFAYPRQQPRNASVMQTFYTTTAPTTDLLVSQNAVVSSSTNSAAPRFVSKGSSFMYASMAQQYYDVTNGWYAVQVEMVAENAGTVGNIPAETLDTVVSGASGFQTINQTASDYGRDTQSNLSLAEGAMATLYSVDSGTVNGYYKSAVSVPGAIEVKVVMADDPFMMRDWDPIRKKHIGGKVDIYIKGYIARTITETFAFTYSVAKNIRFDVVDPVNLILRARDSRLSASNPIQEILNNPVQGYGIRNHSDLPTAWYNLTGAIIIDYNLIQLNASIQQPSTMYDDFIEGDYRYVNNNQLIPTVQPVESVTSVTGGSSGLLDPTYGYTLYKLEDPLLDGESTEAQDYISISQYNGLPTGDVITVNDEEHILIGQFEEPLGSVGINSFTVIVYSKDRLTTYEDPTTPNPDYLLIPGTQTTSMKIVRTVTSNIPSGGTVSIDYQHDENFEVVYVVNDVLQQVNTVIQSSRHVTADVAIKESLENPLEIQATIQLEPNATQSVVDQTIRTSLTQLADKRGMGTPIYQSDAIAVIQDTDGVDYIVQPLTMFTLQDGAMRIRDEVLTEEYTFLQSLSQGFAAVYILMQPLPYSTSDGGGPNNVCTGVYMDELVMTKASSLVDVGKGVGKWWIIGNQGAVIPGYSDDATLYPTYITAAAVAARRLVLTANTVIISLDASSTPYDAPTNHDFAATYIISGDKGSADIDVVSPIEYLTCGNVTITYKSA